MGRGQRCLGWCEEEPWGWESTQGGCKARWAPRAGGEPSLQAEKATLVGRAGDPGVVPNRGLEALVAQCSPGCAGLGCLGCSWLRVCTLPACQLPATCPVPAVVLWLSKVTHGDKGTRSSSRPHGRELLWCPRSREHKTGALPPQQTRSRCGRGTEKPGARGAAAAPRCGVWAPCKGFSGDPANEESRRRGAEKDAGPGWDLQGGAAPRRAVFGRKQLISAEPGWSPVPGRCVRGWDGMVLAAVFFLKLPLLC